MARLAVLPRPRRPVSIPTAIRLLTNTPVRCNTSRKPLTQLGLLAELFGQDVAGAQQGVGGRGHLAVGVDEVGRPGVQIGAGRRGFEDFAGQRLQAARTGQRGQRLLLRLVRQIQVFQPLGRGGRENLLGQLFGQFALRLDRAEDGLLAVGQQTHLGQPSLNLADLLLIQPPRLVLAVAGDEGNGVPLVEQLHRGLDLAQRDIQPTSNLPQVDRYRTCHI